MRRFDSGGDYGGLGDMIVGGGGALLIRCLEAMEAVGWGEGGGGSDGVDKEGEISGSVGELRPSVSS